MKFRYRVSLLFVAVGLFPLIVVVIVGLRFVNTSVLRADIVREEVGASYLKQDIQKRVFSISQQIQDYAALHPEKSMEDRLALPEDEDLALIAATSIGDNGYSFVYDFDGVVMFHPDPDMVGSSLFQLSETLPELWAIISRSLSSSIPVDGYYSVSSDGIALDMYMLAFRIPNTSLLVAVTVDTDEFLSVSPARLSEEQNQILMMRLIYNALLIGLGLSVFIFAVVVSNSLAKPMEWVVVTVQQLMRHLESFSGNLKVQGSNDEIEFLGNAIGVISKQLREQLSNLESVVRERTADLARRTAQVETAAQVARESAEILDVEQLLEQTTHLISERFGFYHAGIFLVDQASEYVVLKAANSEGGQLMLLREHKLSFGQGVVGSVAHTGESRIVSEVGKDAIHLNNPDLPYTRSEMALPLRVRGKVIGVLDVQSTDPGAYTDDDVRILQVLADQLALAIENASLYNQSQNALRELELTYGQRTYEGWRQRLGDNALVYSYDRLGVQMSLLPAKNTSFTKHYETSVKKVEGNYLLTVPLLLRNQPLGVVVMQREIDQPSWSEEEIRVVEEAAIQIASTLENARLLEEIARRAQQESLITQVTSKVQTSLDLEAVLTTAVREIGLAFSASRVEVDLSAGASLDSAAQPEKN